MRKNTDGPSTAKGLKNLWRDSMQRHDYGLSLKAFARDSANRGPMMSSYAELAKTWLKNKRTGGRS